MKLQRYKGVPLKLLGRQIANQDGAEKRFDKLECRNPSGMETLSTVQWFYKESNEIHLRVKVLGPLVGRTVKRFSDVWMSGNKPNRATVGCPIGQAVQKISWEIHQPKQYILLPLISNKWRSFLRKQHGSSESELTFVYNPKL